MLPIAGELLETGRPRHIDDDWFEMAEARLPARFYQTLMRSTHLDATGRSQIALMLQQTKLGGTFNMPDDLLDITEYGRRIFFHEVNLRQGSPLSELEWVQTPDVVHRIASSIAAHGPSPLAAWYANTASFNCGLFLYLWD